MIYYYSSMAHGPTLSIKPSRIMHPRHFILILAAVIFLVLFATSLQMQQFIEGSLSRVQSLIEAREFLGFAIFFLLTMLSAMLSPLSSVPLIPIAVLAWGDVLTLLLTLGGWVVGGSISFMLARTLGRHVLRKFISFEHIDHYLAILPQRLGFELLLLFRLAIPAEIPGYVVGLTKFPFFPYLLATVMAEFPFAVISVYASEAFLEKKFIPLLMWIIVGGLIIGITFHVFRKVLRKYREADTKSLSL